SRELRKGRAGAWEEPSPHERDRYIRNIEAVCVVVQRWCELVRGETERASMSDWEEQQVRDLRTAVQKMLPTVEDELDQLDSNHPSRAVASGVTIMQKTLRRLRTLLALPTSASRSADNICERSLFLTAPNLDVALARRLLFAPNLVLDDKLQPTDFAVIALAMRDSLP